MAQVTDLVIVKKRTGETEVWLDGAPWARLEADIVVLFNLRREQELDETRLKKILQENDIIRARQVLARYMALTMRTERQARENLIRRGYKEDVIEAALERARELGWIDDRRYAGAYVRQRERMKPAGPRRLRADLAARGVAPERVDEALEEFGPDAETQRVHAMAQAEKKGRLWSRRYEGADLKSRLIQFLGRQGYDGDIVHSVVREVLKKEEEHGQEHGREHGHTD